MVNTRKEIVRTLPHLAPLRAEEAPVLVEHLAAYLRDDVPLHTHCIARTQLQQICVQQRLQCRCGIPLSSQLPMYRVVATGSDGFGQTAPPLCSRDRRSST